MGSDYYDNYFHINGSLKILDKILDKIIGSDYYDRMACYLWKDL